MTLDPAIRLGDIFVLVGFLFGGLGFIWAMRGEIKMLAKDVAAQGLKIDKLEAVITQQAVNETRMNHFEQKIGRAHV